LDLIASFEGFRARAAKTPDGRWTLGFGHVKTAKEGLSVSRSEAEDLLRWDLRTIEDAVRQSALMPFREVRCLALPQSRPTRGGGFINARLAAR
jgi:lysozyme